MRAPAGARGKAGLGGKGGAAKKGAAFSGPAYLIVANDPWLAREAEREAVEAIVPPDARSMSLLALPGAEADPAAAVDFLQTFSFFGGRKLLVIRDIETCKAWKDLLPYLKDPNPSSCLLMTSAALRHKDHKAKLTALSAAAELVERKRPAGRYLAEWARKRFAERGKEAGEEVVRALVETVGSDLSTLASEVEKVCLYAGAERKITTAHLAVSLAGGGEGNVFAFLDAVADRDLPGAVRLGREMLEGDVRMEQLLAMLARTFRQLLRAKGLKDAGVSGAEAARQAGVLPFLVERFIPRLARWNQAELAEAVEKLSAGDLAVKRGRLPADVVLDALLVRLLRS